MFGDKSAKPAEVEPRYKSFSIRFICKKVPKVRHQSTEGKFSQVSGENSVVLVTHAGSISLELDRNRESYDLKGERSKLASSTSEVKEHEVIAANSLAGKPVKNDHKVTNTAKSKCRRSRKVKENKLAADNLSGKRATYNTQTQSNFCNRLTHYCPISDECDWQLGQLLRCIHLNEDITLCEMFCESWKDCKKKAGQKYHASENTRKLLTKNSVTSED